MKRKVAILVFDDAEVLDFSGPFEVFAVASELHDHKLFDVFLVADTDRSIRAVNGLRVVPDYTVSNAPAADVVVIAGGAGSRQAMRNTQLLTWLERAVTQAEVIMSVCSGARLLAALGAFDGLKVTTHHEVLDHIRALAPKAEICPRQRFTDNGKIITTGGISAGIDGSFHVVARLQGLSVAENTARYMEYNWAADHTYTT